MSTLGDLFVWGWGWGWFFDYFYYYCFAFLHSWTPFAPFPLVLSSTYPLAFLSLPLSIHIIPFGRWDGLASNNTEVDRFRRTDGMRRRRLCFLFLVGFCTPLVASRTALRCLTFAGILTS